jgi:SAM-dependent methyltransferase
VFAELQKYLKRPEIYERTTEKFWDDEHISAQMLEAHLNPNTDAASRKPEFVERSAAWIALLLPEGASLLDIGCGPGLYARRFAAMGLHVTGVDISERSIAYARAHDPHSEYIQQDYLGMDFENLFDMVTLIWCDYGALIPKEREVLLQNVFRALKPGGLFLLDVFTPVGYASLREHTTWENNEKGGFWSPDKHICLSAVYKYPGMVNLNRYVIIEESAVRTFNIWNCCFTRESLLAEVGRFGFAESAFFSDVAGAPYKPDRETLCAVLKKRK